MSSYPKSKLCYSPSTVTKCILWSFNKENIEHLLSLDIPSAWVEWGTAFNKYFSILLVVFGRQRNSEYSGHSVILNCVPFYALLSTEKQTSLFFCCYCHFIFISLSTLYVFLFYWSIVDLQWLSCIKVIQLYIYMCVCECIYILYIYLDSIH